MGFKVNRTGGMVVGAHNIGGDIPPSGTINITENGTYNVGQYASAEVNTPQPSGKITISQNGNDIDVSSYALADVDVAGDISVDEDYTVSEGTLTSATVIASDIVTANIPDGVTTIKAGTFSGNQYIQKVIMPNSVTNIENGNPYPPQGAFMDCSNLYEIIFSNNLTSIGNFAFYNCNNIHSINLPNSLQSLGCDCFNSCYNLSTINFPSNIKSISETCFTRCYMLGSSDVLDLTNIETIGNSSFEYSGVRKVIFSTALASIGSYAFRGCFNIGDIYYTGTQEEWEQITIGTDAIPQGVTIHYDYVPQ